jgi:26S proteasome regulatory subunit N1
MAKENGAPTAAEKGKGKVEEDKNANGEKKVEEVKKDKDGKPIVNGKKDDKPAEGQ